MAAKKAAANKAKVEASRARLANEGRLNGMSSGDVTARIFKRRLGQAPRDIRSPSSPYFKSSLQVVLVQRNDGKQLNEGISSVLDNDHRGPRPVNVLGVLALAAWVGGRDGDPNVAGDPVGILQRPRTHELSVPTCA